MATVRLVVSQANMDLLLGSPGGAVVRHVDKIGDDLYRTALRLCPVARDVRWDGTAPGRLKAAIRHRTTAGRTPTTRVWIDTKAAPHYKYVLRGTSSPIEPRTALRMGPFNHNGAVGILARQVSGQRPNNFLEAALTEIKARW